ncbi:hypothetical protein SESBI_15158 [Sesbania bispinosa]|nr:hypothetical protein SESBI_15158 [Sesbania bispinosa]
MVARVMLENGYQYGRGLGRKGGKEVGQARGKRAQNWGVPICDIRESFISAGFEHSNLIALQKGILKEM